MKSIPVYLTLAICLLSITGDARKMGRRFRTAHPEISPSNPPGIYSGEVVVTIAEYCARVHGSESSTRNIGVSFSQAGIPLNYVSGEPERAFRN